MNTIFITFLPEIQKYLHTYLHTLYEVSEYHLNRNVEEIVLNETKQSKSITFYQDTKIDVLEFCANNSSKFSEQEKKIVIDLIKQIKDSKVRQVSLIKTLTKFTYDKSINELKNELLDVEPIYKTYNDNVNKLNKIFQDKFSDEHIITFKTTETRYTSNGYYSYNTKGETILGTIDVAVSQLKINEVKISPSNKKYLKEALQIMPDILQNTLTESEYDAKTDNSFVVYCRTNDNEGFLNKNSFYAAFNQAESFPDISKAKRACSSRGVQNYEIFPTSTTFDKSVEKSPHIIRGNVINNILTLQEKQLIQKMMQTQYVKDIEQKIKNYEEILKNNNLLPESNQQKDKKNFKI